MQPEVSLPCPNGPPLIPILSQMNQVHVFQSYFLMIHFNIILHLRLGFPSGLFPHKNPVYISLSFSAYHMPCPSHPPTKFQHPDNGTAYVVGLTEYITLAESFMWFGQLRQNLV